MIKQLSILLISLVFEANAQIDSAVSFCPLQTDNMWQYWYHYTTTNSSESTYVTTKIIGDTLMPNGKLYEIVDGPLLTISQSKYLRVDSTTACVYSYAYSPELSEWLIDSLLAQPMDVFGSGNKCTAVDTMTVFGIKTVVKTFDSPQFVPSPSVTYAQGFGIIKSVTFEDDPVWPIPRAYTYDLVYAKINGQEYGTLTKVAFLTQAPLPTFTLEQNYPNPFNPSTNIGFGIPSKSFVTLKIFDALGREVATLVNEYLSKGNYTRQWRAKGAPTGIYFYSLVAGSYKETKKLILLR